MTVIAVALTTGLILVKVAISVVIALARKRGLAQKRGMFQHPASRNEMPEWMCGMVIVE
jgi:UDP-N-acetylmuramyl pentapeptide phosphotransferase/UDP-N-acetylglucosamine-1-phosphate transferase